MLSKNSTLDLTDFKKEKLFNRFVYSYLRNISFFRDNFNQNDTTQLPFMSSLRDNHIIKREYLFY